MATSGAIHEMGGPAVPEAGIWDLDPAHTAVMFTARHLMVTKVRGRFHDLSGWIVVSEQPEDSRVEVEVATGSIDTGEPRRDEHLRSPDFLDVQRFPSMRFVSTGLERTGERTFRLPGELTIRDVTRPVTLDVEYLGLFTDPFGNRKAAFSAQAEIDREDWGITWNVALETGGWLVSQKVRLEIEVQATPAVRQEERVA